MKEKKKMMNMEILLISVILCEGREILVRDTGSQRSLLMFG